jgi:hypothetical protein
MQFAAPRSPRLDECYFYHRMDLPGVGTVGSEWDLRAGIDAYLGDVDFAGRSAVDVGTASGLLCFEMERRGATVIGYDLSDEFHWDVVPYDGVPQREVLDRSRVHLRFINNAWWFARNALGSRANVVYGPVYEIDQRIEPVDIAMCGSVLLHLRDPVLALEKISRVCRDTLVICDKDVSSAHFIPEPTRRPMDTWWLYPASTYEAILKVFGFRRFTVTQHKQTHAESGQEIDLFTLVARRG